MLAELLVCPGLWFLEPSPRISHSIFSRALHHHVPAVPRGEGATSLTCWEPGDGTDNGDTSLYGQHGAGAGGSEHNS